MVVKVAQYLLIFALMVSLFSCKKSRYDIVKDIVSQVVGTYTTTKICSTGNSTMGYTYDTTNNTQLAIIKTSDTIITANGFVMSYCGTQNNQYLFCANYGRGGGTDLTFDMNYKLVSFAKYDMAGEECNYYPH